MLQLVKEFSNINNQIIFIIFFAFFIKLYFNLPNSEILTLTKCAKGKSLMTPKGERGGLNRPFPIPPPQRSLVRSSKTAVKFENR